MKKLIVAAFCLFLSMPAIAGGWTNWFTIDTLGYDLALTDGSHAFFYIIPDGTIENPDLCSSTTKYVGGANNGASASVGNTGNNREISKLPTLAYTAGWQIRLHLGGCSFNLPYANAVEIKKP